VVNASHAVADVQITHDTEGGWDGVKIVVDIQLDSEDLQDVVDLREVKQDGEYLFLLSSHKKPLPTQCIKANLRIILPADSQEFDSFTIAVVAGTLTAESFSRNPIKVFKAMGVSVDFQFEDLVDSEQVEVYSVSGNVRLERISSQGDIVVGTRSGTIDIVGADSRGSIKASSTSGTITLEGVKSMAEMSVKSTSGSVHISSNSGAGAANLATVSGTIEAQLQLA